MTTPGEGVHKARMIGDLAVVDTLGTIVGVGILTAGIGKVSKQPSVYMPMLFVMMLVCFTSLGIILHRVFHVRTTVDRVLFPDVIRNK